MVKYVLGERVRVTATVKGEYQSTGNWSARRVLVRTEAIPNIEGVYIGSRYRCSRYEGTIEDKMEARSIWPHKKKRHVVLLVAIDERTIAEAFPWDVARVEEA